jgi:hypothetical protein
MLEWKAEMLILEHKLNQRIRRTRVLFWIGLVLSNLLTEALAVAVALAVAHDIWRLRP